MVKPAADWSAEHLGFFLRRHSRLWVVPSALALCAAVALVDYGPGQRLSCLLFYLLPVALAAWWGGFAAGVLLAVAAALLRALVCAAHGVDQPPAVQLWDGAVHFGIFTLSCSLVSRLRQALAREHALARTDPITGAANGRTFYERVDSEARRGQRSGRPLTLAYLDVDNFKEVNDRLGHPAGDELLREVALVIREQSRTGDLAARLGGDEFALLLPETDAAGAAAMLGRLRETLLRRVAARKWPVTFSIGAATFPRPASDVDELVGVADRLMYRAKHGGKDRLVHEVVQGRAPAGPARAGRERRAAVRQLCGRTARVTAAGALEEREWLALVRDISPCGMGLWADYRLPEGALLTVELLSAGTAATPLARVVRVVAEDGGWLHGCVLAARLSDGELREWLPAETPAELQATPGPTDELPDPERRAVPRLTAQGR
jgi:diguanylate cyclase (GGDEF)-like protein